MNDKIQNTKSEAVGSIMRSESLGELEGLRIAYLGRQGRISQLITELKDLSPSERAQAGQVLNDAKQTIEKTLAEQKRVLSKVKEEKFDPSIPGKKYKAGSLHPTTIVINEMFDVFRHLGFSIIEGPEIETEDYNFARLNLPKDHPARSLQDALYISDPDIVLRTHTSSVEARSLESFEPPYRVVIAGKCYRYEDVNASNNSMFYQFQGFALQEGLTMADLRGTLNYFVHQFFGENRKIRFRCKYYPEVEPGAGLDLDCPFCNQKGCSVCKGRGWIEMLGCGMIHPNMLREAGHNPAKISGFAFGMGLDRIVMDRFGINDIRSLYNGDLKFM